MAMGSEARHQPGKGSEGQACITLGLGGKRKGVLVGKELHVLHTPTIG